MGGAPKGLLRTDSGETITETLVSAALAVQAEVRFIGAHAAYAQVAPFVSRVADDARTEGPLAGLLALAEAAQTPFVVPIACDMPRVDAALLRALLDAPDEGDVRAMSRGGWVEPFVARYRREALRDAALEVVSEGRRSLRAVLAKLDVRPFEAPAALWDDWDAPEDLPPALRGQLRRGDHAK